MQENTKINLAESVIAGLVLTKTIQYTFGQSSLVYIVAQASYTFLLHLLLYIKKKAAFIKHQKNFFCRINLHVLYFITC